jgi:hypothetical protein
MSSNSNTVEYDRLGPFAHQCVYILGIGGASLQPAAITRASAPFRLLSSSEYQDTLREIVGPLIKYIPNTSSLRKKDEPLRELENNLEAIRSAVQSAYRAVDGYYSLLDPAGQSTEDEELEDAIIAVVRRRAKEQAAGEMHASDDLTESVMKLGVMLEQRQKLSQELEEEKAARDLPGSSVGEGIPSELAVGCK